MKKLKLPKKTIPTASNKKPSSKKIRVAIVGTGGMASAHAAEFRKINGCEVVAGCDIHQVKLDQFLLAHEIPKGFTSFDEMIAWGEFDAVSVVVPDGLHAPFSIAALKAGKHVLCEKPLALDYPEAKRMVAAAKKAGVVHMVQFSYRSCSALQGVADLIARGKLGDLRHVEAIYQQGWLVSKAWGDWRKKYAWLWRLSTGHGSMGVLGDVGVHILDFAMYPAGAIRKVYCQLKTFPKIAGERVGEFVLDANDSAVMNVEFANGAIGTIHTSRWIGGHLNRLFLKISGTKGSVEIDTDRSSSIYRICCGKDLETSFWREVDTKPVKNNFVKFIEGVRSGALQDPDFARGAEIQKILDACFQSSEQERPVTIQR